MITEKDIDIYYQKSDFNTEVCAKLELHSSISVDNIGSYSYRNDLLKVAEKAAKRDILDKIYRDIQKEIREVYYKLKRDFIGRPENLYDSSAYEEFERLFAPLINLQSCENNLDVSQEKDNNS